MTPLDLAGASDLAEALVRQEYQRRKRPSLGSQLKILLSRRAEQEGKVFDERTLGFEGFGQFLDQCKGLKVKRRSGSDLLVFPAENYADAQEIEPPRRLRIRQKIWFAFVSFPEPGQQRAYNRVTESVVYEAEGTPLGEKLRIEPISQEEQLGWRREFAAIQLGESAQNFQKALTAENPFREFSLLVKRHRLLHESWTSFMVEKVKQKVGQWAQANGIPVERWQEIQGRVDDEPSKRRELYALLDRIPLNRLLSLPIPLGVLLEVERKR